MFQQWINCLDNICSCVSINAFISNQVLKLSDTLGLDNSVTDICDSKVSFATENQVNLGQKRVVILMMPT